MTDAGPPASVVITTKNRKEDLRGAIASALAQTAGPEVIVVNDGSDDGTSEMVRREFPAVRLVSHEQSRGYIVRRNEAAALASAPIIFSIDDDAIFASPRTIEQTLGSFECERVGAVAIPFTNTRLDSAVHQLAPDAAHVYVCPQYVGTAHAIRRSLFLSLGGYREMLIHQGEETDLAARMLERGYVVRLGAADPIHHLESPRRDFRRMDYYGRRNDILFASLNVPMPNLLPHLTATTLKGIGFGFRIGRPWRALQGLAAGYSASVRYRDQRAPVSRSTYQLLRTLRRKQIMALEEIEPALRPMDE